MVASNMGLLRRMAKWNLWYMNIVLDCILDSLFCFLFFIFCVLVWYSPNFFVFNKYHYRARWASAYVSTLHCEILSSCEQISDWHFQHYRWFTPLYGPIIILWGCTTKLSYLSCLLLCFEAPILKMKMGSSDFVLVGEYWEVFKAIR